MANSKYKSSMGKKAEDLMAKGTLKKHVAVKLGISEETFYKYIKQHDEFSESIKRGEGRFVEWAVSKIKESGNKQWQAIAWLLERTHREDFALKTEVQHSGEIQIEHTKGKRTAGQLKESIFKRLKK